MLVRKVYALKTPTKQSRKYTTKGVWKLYGDKKCFFRSLWEVSYADYLEWLKKNKAIIDWEYEPETFWFYNIKRGVRSYKPDFKVFNQDGTHHWVEVKGYMDPKSQTKIKRFKKYYPGETLVIVNKKQKI